MEGGHPSWVRAEKVVAITKTDLSPTERDVTVLFVEGLPAPLATPLTLNTVRDAVAEAVGLGE